MGYEHAAQLGGDLAEALNERLDVVGVERGMIQRQQIAMLVEVLARLAQLRQPQPAAQRALDLRTRL